MNDAPPAPMREEDYEAIEAAVMETARGRWFLAEFARRNRTVDASEVMEAVARVERVAAEAALHKPVAALCEEVVATRALIETVRNDLAARERDNISSRDLAALRETVERALGATLSRLAEAASPRDLKELREGLEQALAASERTGREALAGLRQEMSGTSGALDALRNELLARLMEAGNPHELGVLRETVERALGTSERAGRELVAGLREDLTATRVAIEAALADLATRLGEAATPDDLVALREAVERAIGASERASRETALGLHDELGATRGAIEAALADVTKRLGEPAASGELAALRGELGATRAAIEPALADVLKRLGEASGPADLAALRESIDRALGVSERTGQDLVLGLKEELGTARALIEGTRADLLARFTEVPSGADLASLRESVGEALGASERTVREVLAGLREELAATRGAIEGARADLIARLADAAGPRDLTALREVVERVIDTTERAGRDVLAAAGRIEDRLAKAVTIEPPPPAPKEMPAPEMPATPPVAEAIRPAASEPLDHDGEDDLFEPIVVPAAAPAPTAGPPQPREEMPAPPRPAPVSIGSAALALEEAEPEPQPVPKLERLDFAELSFVEKAALFS